MPTLNPDTEYSALVVRDEQEPPNENGGMKTDTLEEEAQAPSGNVVSSLPPSPKLPKVEERGPVMIANINWKVITRTCIVPSTWTRQHLAQNIGAESFPTISTTFKLERSRSVKEVRVVAQGMTLWGEYDFSGREDMEIDLDLVIDERAELSWVCTMPIHSISLSLHQPTAPSTVRR